MPVKRRTGVRRRRRQRGGADDPPSYEESIGKPRPPPPSYEEATKPVRRSAPAASRPAERRGRFGRVISRGLRAVGLHSWADKAHQAGYGRGSGLAGYQKVLKLVRAKHPSLSFRAQQQLASRMYHK